MSIAAAPTERVIAEAPWRLVITPPWPGAENMDYDRRTLQAVGEGTQAPTLRLFQWAERTVSFGRLQNEDKVRVEFPSLPIVRRPTGGGVVVHEGDWCLSLCWPNGLSPLPPKPQDQYAWIHTRIQAALSDILTLDMLACCDAPDANAPFDTRQCFTNPVGSDLLSGGQKVVGGALARQRRATLYQGSLQLTVPALPDRLLSAFQRHLTQG